jgi:hypothetical protein
VTPAAAEGGAAPDLASDAKALAAAERWRMAKEWGIALARGEVALEAERCYGQ